MLGQQVVAQVVQVGHGAAAGDQAVVQPAGVALHRHVQRHAVRHDRHRVVADQPGARKVHWHRAAGHVGNHHVGQRRQRVQQPRARHDRSQARHQPGRAKQRKVGGDGGLDAAQHRLGGARGFVDGAQPLQRVVHVGRERHGEHADLVVGRRIARAAQTHRHGRQQGLGRQVVVLAQVAAQRARGGSHHHVVERATQRLADQFGLGQRDGAAGKGALVGDAHVQQRARAKQFKVLRQAPVAFAVGVFLGHHHVAQGAQHGRRGLDQLDQLLAGVAQRGAAQLGNAQLVLVAAHARARRLDHAASRLQVKHRLRHGHAGLAVHARVVRLDIQRHLAVLEAVDHEKLPQRAAAVEQAGVQPRHVLLQLPVAAGAGQGDVAHVVIEVDVLVFHPDRVGQIKRHQRQLAREQLGQVHALGHARLGVLEKIAGVARRQVDHVERADVHRHLGRFQVQEHGVQATQVIHRSLLGADGQPGIFKPMRAPRPTPARQGQRQADPLCS